jgi:hypothetical protein
MAVNGAGWVAGWVAQPTVIGAHAGSYPIDGIQRCWPRSAQEMLSTATATRNGLRTLIQSLPGEKCAMDEAKPTSQDLSRPNRQ